MTSLDRVAGAVRGPPGRLVSIRRAAARVRRPAKWAPRSCLAGTQDRASSSGSTGGPAAWPCARARSGARGWLSLVPQPTGAAGKTDGEADALASLGRVYLRQGDLGRAAEHLELALARYRQHGYPGAEANALNGLGQVFHGRGDLARAIECHERALDLNRRDGTRTGEAAALNGLAETLRTAGAWEQARGYHAEAMALAAEAGDRYQQGNAHQGLAALAEAAGETAEARTHWERALDIFTVLGTADADQVRGRLRRSAQRRSAIPE